MRDAERRGRPYHVVHFDGHGTWTDLGQTARAMSGGTTGGLSRHRYSDPRGGAHGYLLFEEPDAPRNVSYVSGPQLGDLLAQAGVPVLVLNACRSAHAELATTPEEATAQVEATPGDPHARVRAYGSLAQEVIDQGVAGVVAMRYNVYVVTAARFVGELYASLLSGQGLGEAVSRGRQHLAEDPTREISLRSLALQDWMVPVVYEATPLAIATTTGSANAITITVPEAARGQAQLEEEISLPGPPDVGFYGRDETLLALDRAFDTQQLVLLHAYAGAGKTTTAAEFARWYQITGGTGLWRAATGPCSSPRSLTIGRLALSTRPGWRSIRRCVGGRSVCGWGALVDAQRRDVAVQVLSQVPVVLDLGQY